MKFLDKLLGYDKIREMEAEQRLKSKIESKLQEILQSLETLESERKRVKSEWYSIWNIRDTEDFTTELSDKLASLNCRVKELESKILDESNSLLTNLGDSDSASVVQSALATSGEYLHIEFIVEFVRIRVKSLIKRDLCKDEEVI